MQKNKRICRAVCRYILFVAIVLGASTANAQDDGNYDDFRNSIYSGMDEFRKKTFDNYLDFRQKINAEYASFLEKAWVEYNGLAGRAIPKEESVPPIIYKEEEKKKPIEDKPVVIDEMITPGPVDPQPKPVTPIEEQPTPKQDTLDFTFYGTIMRVRASKNLIFHIDNICEKSLAATWNKLSTKDYDNLIFDCLSLRDKHKLSDWAYLRMLDKMSEAFLGSNTNEATLLKAFVFCQSGYKMRLALAEKKLIMLFGTKHIIFKKYRWTIDGTNYYTDKYNGNRLSLCSAAFPNEKDVSLYIKEEHLLSNIYSEKCFVSPNSGNGQIKVVENKNNISLYNEFPTSYIGDNTMTRWAIYAETPLSSSAKNSLYPKLKNILEGKTKRDAVQTLLTWIQNSFEYEYDDKVWGYDRTFFPDESLYYPFTDCEDRSILLTRIVKDLLGLRCALVYYPGHLAAAIAIGEEERGDYIRINNKKYIICDPTYIGAPVGKTMEGFDNKSAKVIVLSR